jgi:NodT family efflux transporter outer membrane factor (OMF) lipoprotein
MKLALFLLLPAALTACTHVPQRDAGADRPQVPAGWRTTLEPQVALQRDWWNRFGDPVLTQLVETALAHNLDVATAASRVREARAQEALSRAQEFPSLDFGFGINRGRNLNALGQSTITTTRQAAFQAAYEVDLSGRIAEQVAAAAAAVDASEAARDAAALSVAAATASGYITLRSLDARLVILQETVTSRAEAMRVAGERADVGYTSDLERRQAEAEYESAAQQVPQLQLAIERQEHALALLTGTPPRDIPRGLPLARLATPPVPDALPSDLLRRRPDIAQAESTLVAADATLASARAQFLPSLRLSASAGQLAVSSLPNPLAIWSIGASVLAPIFNGGRIQAQVDTAAARREQAAFGYQRTVLTAFREVEDNLAAVMRTREQRSHLQAQRVSLADALFHAGRRYRAGYSSYLEQLDAQRGVLAADLALVQARADELAALVALSQAMGGGWTPDAR